MQIFKLLGPAGIIPILPHPLVRRDVHVLVESTRWLWGGPDRYFVTRWSSYCTLCNKTSPSWTYFCQEINQFHSNACLFCVK